MTQTNTINGIDYRFIKISYNKYENICVFYQRSSTRINRFIYFANTQTENESVLFILDETVDKTKLKLEVNDFLLVNLLPHPKNYNDIKIVSITQMIKIIGFNLDDLIQFSITNNKNTHNLKIKLVKEETTPCYFTFSMSSGDFIRNFDINYKNLVKSLINFKNADIQKSFTIFEFLTSIDDEQSYIVPATLNSNKFNKLITLNKNLTFDTTNIIDTKIIKYSELLFSYIQSLQKNNKANHFKFTVSGIDIEIQSNQMALRLPGFNFVTLNSTMFAFFLNAIDEKTRNVIIDKLEVFKLKNT